MTHQIVPVTIRGLPKGFRQEHHLNANVKGKIRATERVFVFRNRLNEEVEIPVDSLPKHVRVEYGKYGRPA